MTDNEIINIVNQVLAIVRTNSKTIEQLTPVGEIEDNARFEITGGRSVAVGDLLERLRVIFQEDLAGLWSAIENETNNRTNRDSEISGAMLSGFASLDARKLNRSDVADVRGDSPARPISQRAASDALDALEQLCDALESGKLDKSTIVTIPESIADDVAKDPDKIYFIYDDEA